MTIDINKVLEGAVAIPYSQEVLSCLATACESYMQDDSDFQKFEELTCTFLSGRMSEDFRQALSSALEDNELDNSIPDNVIVRLSLFSLCSSINPDNEFNAAIRATIFMNYMLIKKDQYNSLPNSTYIKDIYKCHIPNYLTRQDSLVVGEHTDFIEKIAGTGTQYLQNGISDPNDVKQIQMLVKEASLYRVGSCIESVLEKKIENPYLRIFVCFNEIMDSVGYLYYNLNLQKIISKLVQDNEEGRGRKNKLSTFINDLREKSLSDNQPCLKSSILLRLIYSYNDEDLNQVLEISFSIKEFAIYLYYEMLLEKIIKKLSE